MTRMNQVTSAHEAWIEMHLNDLPHLSPGAKGALGKLGCWSERDVATLSKRYLRSRPGVGKKIIAQVERMLDEFDLHFSDASPLALQLAELRERERTLQRDLARVQEEIAEISGLSV